MKKTIFDKEDFITQYNKLKSSRKMAEYYGCSKGVILKYAKEIGYNVEQNKLNKIANQPYEIVKQEYEQCYNCNEVGKKYNCSGIAVANFLKKNGYDFKTNPKNKLALISDDEFIESYDILQSAVKMGEKYNCSSTAILQRAHKIGYDPNSNKHYKLSEIDKEFIRNSYNKLSSIELSKQFNVSRGMITKIWFDSQLIGKTIDNKKTTEIDLTGQRFGQLTVLNKTEKRSCNGNIVWHCLCDCGLEKDISGAALRNGTTITCGSHPSVSKGNYKIRQLLTEAGIPFEMEKKFTDCKDQKQLPFDFYVNNSYLIEYDGKQHYKPHQFFDYESTHAHDLIKTQYCKNNNIPLIRIPYTHYDNITLSDLLLETSPFIE